MYEMEFVNFVFFDMSIPKDSRNYTNISTISMYLYILTCHFQRIPKIDAKFRIVLFCKNGETADFDMIEHSDGNLE